MCANIELQFRQAYPSAQITHNAKLVGRFSKVERQIDLLIGETAADFAFRIVILSSLRDRLLCHHPCFIAFANLCEGSVFSTSSFVSHARRACRMPYRIFSMCEVW